MKPSDNQYKEIVATKSTAEMLIIAAFLSLAFSGVVFGQGRNQEVTIIAPYQPSISDAVKMQVKPEIADTLVKAPEMSYSINSQFIPTTFGIQPLKPVYIQVDPEKSLHRNYLKAGFGNYTTPYAEFFSNSLNSDKYSLGFHVRHLSSKGDITDHPVSAFSNNQASVYGKRYMNDKVLSGRIYYNRDVVHYYGMVPGEDTAIFSLPDDELRQRFSLFGADVSLASNSRGQTGYSAELSYYGFTDLYETTETGFGLKGNYKSRKKLIDIANEEEFGADFTLDLYANSDTVLSQTNIMSGLTPYLRLNFDYLDLTIGLEAAVAADSASKFHVYPEVKLLFKIIPEYLRLYITATGGLQRNSYLSTSRENPWINPVFPLGFTSTSYDFKGGVTGKINQSMDFNLSASYADIENMLFYVNDYYSPFSPDVLENFGNKFTGIYDNVKLTTINAEIGYDFPEKLKAVLALNYRDYNVETEEHPWHKPSVETSLLAKYRLLPKLSLNGELFYIGSSWARKVNTDLTVTSEKIDGYVDLNFGAEYHFNEKMAAFAQINNVTGTRYYRWYNYPSQRINAMAGITIAF